MASLTPDAVEGILHKTMTSEDGHRPVLQVAKVETVSVTHFDVTRTRYKLWLSDGSRWACATATELDRHGDGTWDPRATAGCLVCMTSYSLRPSSGIFGRLLPGTSISLR